MNASSTSHNKTGLADDHQQPLIGDNNLENLSKTGSFLSHLAREFSGGRANSNSSSNNNSNRGSITASSLTAMKATSSRSNSCGSNNSGGGSINKATGKRFLRKQHQPSVSENSVCEEAREVDDPIQCKSMDQPSSETCNPNEQSNENEPNTVNHKYQLHPSVNSFIVNLLFFCFCFCDAVKTGCHS